MPTLTIFHCTVEYPWYDGTPSITEDYVLSETEVGARVLFYLWHKPGFERLGVSFRRITACPIAENVPLLFDTQGVLVKPVADKALYDYVAERKVLHH